MKVGAKREIQLFCYLWSVLAGIAPHRFFPLVLFSFSGCVAWVLLETTCAILSSPQ